jgi:type VI secretion system protein
MLSRNPLAFKALLSFGVIALVLWLPACRRVPSVVRNTIPGASGESKLDLRVHVSPQANNNNPVAVDLVLVSDKELFKELMKMPASEWFEKRNQIRLDYPKEKGLEAGSWEWVPGQVVRLSPMPVKLEITGGIIYARYFTPGAHRARIDPRKPAIVNLGAEEFTVQILK